MKIWSSYHIDNLDEDKQDKLYQVFHDTYVKETGSAFDRDGFDWRAKNWTFFGVAPDTEGRQCGGIAVRVQRSGMVKMVASFGNIRGIMDGLKEMESEMGDKPIWGFMEKRMVDMLKRADSNFVELPSKIVKIMVNQIAKSGTIPGYQGVNDDGSVNFDTPSGIMAKYYVCNKVYVKWLLEGATKPEYKDRIPVPQIVLKPLVKLLEKILGV